MGRRKQRLFEARFKEEAVRRMLNGESIMPEFPIWNSDSNMVLPLFS